MSDRLTATAPQTIYLCVSDEDHDRDEPFPSNVDDVTWSTDGPVNVTVEYVRADLVPTWKPLPDCVGSWNYYPPDQGCVRIHSWWVCDDCLKNPADLLPIGGKWFGPIPEDK